MPAAFYNCSIGLRFEIGIEALWKEDIKKYMEKVHYRSKKIFDEINSNSDELFFVVRKSVYKDISISKMKKIKAFYHYVKNKGSLKKLNCVSETFLYNELKCNEDDEEIYYFYLRCKKIELKYKKLLTHISNQDIGVKPRLDERCFFINITKKIIYHLYDDRGLDVVSNSKQNLKFLYDKYYEWILDYDRNEIDKNFK